MVSPVLCFAGGVALGVVLGLHLAQPSAARCCAQVEALVRDDVRKRCGAFADFCEGAGGALGLFDNAPALLDLFGVTRS